jgi:hypothetical protein
MATSGLAPKRVETGVMRPQGRARGVVIAIYSARWFRLGLCLLGIVAAPLIFEPVVRSGGVDALDRTMVLYILIPPRLLRGVGGTGRVDVHPVALGRMAASARARARARRRSYHAGAGTAVSPSATTPSL